MYTEKKVLGKEAKGTPGECGILEDKEGKGLQNGAVIYAECF